MVSDAGELERMRKEAAALRDLVRELSARQAAAVATLPLPAALALAKGGDVGADTPFPLEPWNETIEMTRADVAPEMALLWRRLPAREGA
jgi:hypothetical protein